MTIRMLLYKIHLFQVLYICLAAASTQVVGHPKGAAATVKTPEVQAPRTVSYPYGYPYAYSYSPVPDDANPDGAAIPVDEPSIQGARADHLPTSRQFASAVHAPPRWWSCDPRTQCYKTFYTRNLLMLVIS
jgi:hypothetical protein